MSGTTTYRKTGQAWDTEESGTLNDANTSDEITTLKSGAVAYIGIALKNMVNGDDFDVELQRYDGAAWNTYSKVNITMAAGAKSFDTGGGAVVINCNELNFEHIYLNSTRKLRLNYTKNGLTDRDFPYWYAIKGSDVP